MRFTVGCCQRTVAALAGMLLLVASLTSAGVSSSSASSSPNHLSGKVVAKSAAETSVETDDGAVHTFIHESNVVIKDEKGAQMQLFQVPLSAKVVLHLQNGQVVELIYLSD